MEQKHRSKKTLDTKGKYRVHYDREYKVSFEEVVKSEIRKV